KIFTRAEHPSGTTTLIPAWADQWRLGMHYEVPAAPLAAILQWDEIKTARLIKIDVEGAEWHVVSGMASLLRACRTDLEIIIEVAPKMLEAEGRTCQEFLDFFAALGFHPYRIENDYSAAAYFAPRTPTRPQRIEQIPTETDQTDLIFSRIDAASL
ncbi:MAG TPA: FkbM family methyltransferase, partial [Acidobacteriota bacterium]